MNAALFGGITVALGGLLFGVTAARDAVRSAERVREARTAVEILSREICGKLSPLPAAVRTARKELPKCEFLSLFEKYADAQGYENAPSCWSRAAEESGLAGDAGAALCELAPVLGRYFGAEQRDAFDTALARLERIFSETREKSRTLGRAYLTLGACMGAALAIILA